MGFLELLFVLLLVLKLAGVITCSWWIVFVPLIIGLLVDVALIRLACKLTGLNPINALRSIRKSFRNK